MSIETWLIFFGTSFIATIIPGPSVLLGLNNGFVYGPQKSVATALGITSAAAIMGIVSLLGLGAVIAASGQVFQMIKYCGAGYLIYIGIKTWSAPVAQIQDGYNNPSGKSSLSLYIQAILVGFSNPKAIIFFTALFPQFLNPNLPQMNQYITIITTLAFVVFLCMMIYVLGGRSLAPLLKKDNVRRLLNRIVGGTFICFAIAVVLFE